MKRKGEITMKKKGIAIVSAFIMCFSFVGCGTPKDFDIKINKPIVVDDIEITFTSLETGGVMTPSLDVIPTYKLDVKAVNNTGSEHGLYNIQNSVELYGPDGTEVNTSISGSSIYGSAYTIIGYTTKYDKQYKEGKVLDGGSKEYTIAFPDPGEDGDYTLIYEDYKLYFNVQHLEKEKGGTTITYPTEEGEQVYQAWATK